MELCASITVILVMKGVAPPPESACSTAAGQIKLQNAHVSEEQVIDFWEYSMWHYFL